MRPNKEVKKMIKMGKTTFEKKESFTHKLAKELLHSWIVEDQELIDEKTISFIDQEGYNLKIGREPHFIFLEYPITPCYPLLIDECDCKAKNNDITLHNCDYRQDYFQKIKYCPCLKCPKLEEPFKFIVDIAIARKGIISNIIEVTHKNFMSETKKKILGEGCWYVFEINAKHILGQIKKPERLIVNRVV